MAETKRTWPVLAFLLVLITLFYPALLLNRILAPQALLWNYPPWSQLAGPNPKDRPALQPAALTLAPRLALWQKLGWKVAIWNPFIANGRPGLLALAAEGVGPVALLTSWFVRAPYHFNAIILVQLALAFWGMYRLAGKFLSPSSSVIASVAYALSGPVTSSWFSPAGSAGALGPWLWLAAMNARWWAPVPLALLLVAGAQSWPFLLGFAALTLWPSQTSVKRPGLRWAVGRLVALATVSVALALPSLYLAWYGTEDPGPWWLRGPTQPPPSLASLLVSQPEHANPNSWAFLGGVTLLLALAGMLAPAPGRTLALGTFLVSGLLVLAPTSWLPNFLAALRPSLTLALGASLLAGLGAQRLVAHVAKGYRVPVQAAIIGFLLFRLLPPANLWLPWESRQRASLPPPWPTIGQLPPHQPLLPLLTLLPPETAALYAAADVRGFQLGGEPRYRAALSPSRDGTVHFSRLADPQLAALGTTWLVEPAEVGLVTGELLSRLQRVQVERQKQGLAVTVPPHATRLAVRVSQPRGTLWLEQGGNRWLLMPDPALGGEEFPWQFFRLPEGLRAGQAFLRGSFPGPADPGSLTLAWDVSGWELFSETDDVRLWRQRFPRPLAAWHGEQKAAPQLVAWRAQEISVQTNATTEGILVLRLKFRPGLLHLRLDGKRLPGQLADELWTAVRVPAGQHVVTASYALPIAVWAVPLVALFSIFFLRKVMA